ncbi:N-acetylmuramoyl-L-alanine amidase [Georgenia phoenicis]|uniref:N-acetylmuramoyl-L-alanine amidase n=1 Tax=unclassified Georgenia TaxID=2626815 RepID=UPI0039AF0A21
MPLLRSAGPTLVVTSLLLGGLTPLAGAQSVPEEPVTVVALTSADRDLTELAVDGLEPLQDDEAQATASGDVSTEESTPAPAAGTADVAPAAVRTRMSAPAATETASAADVAVAAVSTDPAVDADVAATAEPTTDADVPAAATDAPTSAADAPATASAEPGTDEDTAAAPTAEDDAPANDVVDDGAGASTADPQSDAANETDGVAVLTAPIATDEFYVAGVTWDGADALAPDAAVFIRVMENGEWQDWSQLEAEQASDEATTTGGTEPYVAAGAEAVQVQVSGDPEDLPANLRLNLMPEWPAEEEVVLEDDAPVAATVPQTDPLAPAPEPAPLPFQQQTTTAAAARTVAAPQGVASARTAAVASSTAPRPAVISRSGWGANESQMTWRPSYANLQGAVIHHTAGSNNYTQSQSASVVRGIYSYHAITRGWGDIGYNFLIDKWGRVYEGRSGSLASPDGKMPVGAHAAPYNTGTVGLSVMGDYTKVGVPAAAMNAMAEILGWQFGRAGIDATTPYVPQATGQNRSGLNRVFGHRDVSSTACPGNDIYSRLGWLARAANDRAAVYGGLVHTSTVYLNNDWGPLASKEFALGNRSTEVYSGDWDGDGEDTLALRVGNVFHVYNSNEAGAEPWVVGYGRVGDEVLVGDWDGDGRDSLAVRRGKTYYMKNSITSGAADYVIAYGWEGDEVHVGDWNGDGRDTLTVRRQSTYHVKNAIAGGKADHVIAYGRAGDTVVVGDWNGNGQDTFGVRRAATYHVKNSIAGGKADIVQTYGRPGDSVIVGDWDGNGTDTLGVHRH